MRQNIRKSYFKRGQNVTHYLHAVKQAMKLLFVNDTIIADIHNIYQAVMRGLRPSKTARRSIQHRAGWGGGSEESSKRGPRSHLCPQNKIKCCQVPAQEMLLLGVSLPEQLPSYS